MEVGLTEVSLIYSSGKFDRGKWKDVHTFDRDKFGIDRLDRDKLGKAS